MYSKLILSALTCFLFQFAAIGQNSQGEEQLIKNMTAEKATEIKTSQQQASSVQLHQAGTSNQAHVIQRNASSIPNAAFIEQVGVINYATLKQSGQGNSVKATQLGNSNSYSGEIEGISNSSNVLQRGNSNSINQIIRGNSLDYTLIQLGNSNTINQIETTTSSKPYKIVQEGNNMNITIEQSNWGVPKVNGNK